MKDDEKSKQELIAELDQLRRENSLLKQKANENSADGRQDTGKTILIVDDNDGTREMVVQMLKNLGYTTLAAASTQQAMDIFRVNHETIDLILSDVIIPGGSCHEMVTKLLELKPDIQVVFMTGYAEYEIVPDDIFKIQKSRAVLIQKPFTRNEIKARLEQQFAEK